MHAPYPVRAKGTPGTVRRPRWPGGARDRPVIARRSWRTRGEGLQYLGGSGGGLLDGRADAHIGAAAADVSGHGGVDFTVCGIRGLGKQRRRRHDLPRLAVAALDDIHVEPSFLDLLAGGSRADPLDGGNRLVADGTHREDARTDRLSVQVDGAGTALSDAAAELSAHQPDHVPKDPEQGHLGG